MAAVLVPHWFKSSYSNGAGGERLECAYIGDGVLLRDSKDTVGPVIAVGSHAWQRFIDPLRLSLPGS